MFKDHKKQEESTKYNREFDTVSRILVCEDPVRVAALTLKAHAEDDNFDWVVYDRCGWPGNLTYGEKGKP